MLSKYSVCLPMIVVYSNIKTQSTQSPPKWAFNHVLCDNGLGLFLGPLTMVLDLDDDKQFEDQESLQVSHRHRHLVQMDYFLAGSAVFAVSLAAGASLLTGVASAFLASTLQVLSLAGSHLAGAAALAAGAGAAAGVAVLAGSVAKAAVATKVAITVAIVFI